MISTTLAKPRLAVPSQAMPSLAMPRRAAPCPAQPRRAVQGKCSAICYTATGNKG
jgi:hypothetical protein